MSEQLATYLEQWPTAQATVKKVLMELRAAALALDGAAESFVARPGISHSLRYDLSPRPEGRQRPVFFLIDVVEFEGLRCLSVCFYEDEIQDPRELGNAIPQGLFQETGYCFDVDDYDREQIDYLRGRLSQAHRNATGR